ncbi:protein F37C4.5-like isoform X3 [Ptychodera flava]|uniref:protein F37C4.5-like isoform X3 n=1 Tax=Ptychodera flava TaxID=63121 RepID=UPI003969F34A
MESEGAEHSNMKIFEAPDCPVVSVVVYQQDRAEVCRSVVTKLEKGENEVVLRKLSHSIDKDSIRVEGKGPAVINEVTFSSKYVVSQESQDDVRLKELKDRLTECQKDKKVLCTKKHRLQKQRVVLDGFADNLMKPSTVTDKEGTQACLTRVLDRDLLEGMTGFFDLYDGQAARLDADLHQLSMDMERVDEELAVITRNLHKQNAAKDGFQSREVSIMLETREECEVELLISYVVTNAKWTPKYDIRVFSQDKMMKIMYYGMIQQSTGEDWIDTKLSLSTAMPSVGGSPPPLGTQMLTFKPKVLNRSHRDSAHVMLKAVKAKYRFGSLRRKVSKYRETHNVLLTPQDSLCMEMGDEASEEDYGNVADLEVPTAEVRESVTSTAYEITRHSTIPSDNLGHKVSVAIVDLDPVFEHDTVPKRVPHAFVKAIAKNTSQYALLPGPANVFFDNNFVAKTVMRSVSPSEEFDCSLGVDPSVRVIYKPIHKYREQSGIISKTTTTTYRQVIEIKNTRQDAVKITVHEQLPLSSEEKIKVTLQEPSIKDKNDKSKPVRMNKNNNIEWYLEIPSCSSHELVLKYSVEHPSSEDIEVTETAAAQA